MKRPPDVDLLAEIEHAVSRIAAGGDIAPESFPTYGQSDDNATPHIEVDPPYFYYVVRERGEEHERRSTLDLDELLYWIFVSVTYNEAIDYEREHRIDSEDFRRLLFQRQLELLGRLNPRWLDRYRGERAELLREVGVY